MHEKKCKLDKQLVDLFSCHNLNKRKSRNDDVHVKLYPITTLPNAMSSLVSYFIINLLSNNLQYVIISR